MDDGTLKTKADIGLIGLAVMGENLVLNMERNGFTVAVYNRTTEKIDAFLNGRGADKNLIGCPTPEALIAALDTPRKIMIMVKAGPAVDAVIEGLVPLLDPGDILIDGGNSYFKDTIRRTKTLQEKGLLYIGAGVSGGEEGALNGPSIMPGGHPDAWLPVQPIFQKIAAKVEDGTPCCDWVGADGAGHFVKMMHNGIEYGDLQMIGEVYDLMRSLLGMEPIAMAPVFEQWNQGPLDSYLIEITRDILAKTDEASGRPMVDLILDTAGQKGTGKWTGGAALDLGAPAPTLAEAVFSRFLSALKDERSEASALLRGPEPVFHGDRDRFLDDLEQALFAGKICSYAQGFQLLRQAAEAYDWTLNYGDIALMWRGGCIIRARFLGNIKEAFDRDPELKNLLLDPFFRDRIERAQSAWRRVVATAATNGLPIPALSSALAYYDAYRRDRLPAHLLQAQRDYFGAHTYERIDRPRGEFFHTDWTGRGGATSASTYTA